MAMVAAGRDGRLDLAIRGGGYGVPGFGTVDDGLVIDLSRMNNVRVDPVKKVAGSGAARRGVMSTMRLTPSAWQRPSGSSRRPASVA
jgi:hypothetical protein